MPMTDDPKNEKPWFQFHLSTCMVSMMQLGLLIFLNIEFIGLLDRKRGSLQLMSDVLTFFSVFISLVALIGTAHILEQWIRFREGETVKSSVDLAWRSQETLQILKKKKNEDTKEIEDSEEDA